MNRRARLQVYSRAWCHLCDEMIAELKKLPEAANFALEIVDVDADPELEARYGEDIPVLMAGGVELCRHRLDRAKVSDYLRKF